MTTTSLTRYNVELRATVSGNRVEGHAAVFDQIAQVPGHYEQIGRTAFDKVLADSETDVRALYNHNPERVLGRQSAGTLQLRTDGEGLAFTLELPDTSYANDLRALMARGDVTGASFGFIPGDDKWSKAPDGRQLRTHTMLDGLVDVSIVPFPAYEGASATLRHVTFETSVSNRSALVRARARAHLSGRSK